MALDRLIEAIRRKDNPTVAGLDPRLEYLPDYLIKKAFAEYGETLEGAAAAIEAYNRELIDALADVVPAVKPQAAYYELYGWPGMRALSRTIAYAREKGLFVITDGKRNDIGSTMEAYAVAHLGEISINGAVAEPFGGDALTVNGYLGTDGIKPLLGICNAKDKGIFALVKTSNPSSGELQDREIDGEAGYSIMAGMCEAWGAESMGQYGYSAVGAVVGATYPAQLAELRKKAPHTFFLVPGYGAQGGTAADVAGAFDEKGLGAIVNSSRAILTAWKKQNVPGEEYAAAARNEAIRMRDDITQYIPKITL